ncbi:IS110 family transposase [Sphingomonas parapaucimobilis]|uniref:Putative transposase n=1 Tax=Sphingomonas parapaucimobilis NBRC 15100 TaxID=1219049 RepID=A0A0A1WA99_9SPHN|nr:transposase [Sphingomonas parapaucimobilis]GAM01844.1 putative transposase [Sphingomonas parapaucimobilis NBRC 15100]
MPQAVIGCDHSRAFIDICELPSGRIRQIANTPDTIAAWLDTLDHDVRLVFEATSGCDGDLIAALAARGHPFSRVHPRQAREFARATGMLAKNDRVDVRAVPPDLAEVVRLQKPVTFSSIVEYVAPL